MAERTGVQDRKEGISGVTRSDRRGKVLGVVE